MGQPVSLIELLLATVAPVRKLLALKAFRNFISTSEQFFDSQNSSQRQLNNFSTTP